MIDFIQWLGEPSAYNWITISGVFVGLMTAIFTGYTAGTQWLDRRNRVDVEWFHTFNESSINLTCQITNRTKGTIEGDRISVFGLQSSIATMGGHEKHESWSHNESHVSIHIAPGKTETIKFLIVADKSHLERAAGRYSALIGSRLSRFLWQAMQWRFPLGVSLSIRLTLRRRSSVMRPIRITHRIRMRAEMAMQMAQNSDDSAATK